MSRRRRVLPRGSGGRWTIGRAGRRCGRRLAGTHWSGSESDGKRSSTSRRWKRNWRSDHLRVTVQGSPWERRAPARPNECLPSWSSAHWMAGEYTIIWDCSLGAFGAEGAVCFVRGWPGHYRSSAWVLIIPRGKAIGLGRPMCRRRRDVPGGAIVTSSCFGGFGHFY
jgi:hypothetical protein